MLTAFTFGVAFAGVFEAGVLLATGFAGVDGLVAVVFGAADLAVVVLDAVVLGAAGLAVVVFAMAALAVLGFAAAGVLRGVAFLASGCLFSVVVFFTSFEVASGDLFSSIFFIVN
ncbi:hypothetical protein [uncultured Flavobacterium sp.]|uniref:hypothetical protein n=1 Tax=uncultured Flavobacterium sp. TaxID=165435 RepID=UPI0026222BD9|nr:hypothetical protein [uncultured Flavobacterium sp.]